MAKIKLTKTEQKKQQEELKQFLRFLPTLQLKKQQLQMEIRLSNEKLEANRKSQAELRERLAGLLAVFADPEVEKTVAGSVKLTGVKKGMVNIAGVHLPVFQGAEFETKPYDLFSTDWCVDAAVDAVKQALSLIAEYRIIEEQNRLLSKELQTTTQRVNLFEKVKIPECRENIRRIKIYIGDMDTSAVVRSKIAKKKSAEASGAMAS